MKIAVTGDLQFSEQTKLSYQTEEGVTSRLRDQVQCFAWMVEQAVMQHCEGLVVLGDIFDPRRSIPVPVIDRACRAFSVASEHLWIAAVMGNHEAYKRTPEINSLQALLGVAEIWDAPGVDGELAFVPWTEEPGAYRKAIGEVAGQGARYLFSHVTLDGAVPAAGVGIPKKDLRPHRWRRILLGDVHEPLAFPPNIQYAGAPMQHHFGDVAGERGFWVLDTDSADLDFVVNDVSPRFHYVEEAADLEGIRENDFVRVRAEDPDLAEELALRAGRLASWVESETVRLEELPPRLDVKGVESAEGILRRWVEHTESEIPGLVATGLDLLTEVEG
jgi:DNA repair exonuclease SbcCD nuclease subunit